LTALACSLTGGNQAHPVKRRRRVLFVYLAIRNGFMRMFFVQLRIAGTLGKSKNPIGSLRRQPVGRSFAAVRCLFGQGLLHQADDANK
jgi:hypothetical protein